jgi:hypothetical protein
MSADRVIGPVIGFDIPYTLPRRSIVHAQRRPASFESVPLAIPSGRSEPASLAEFRLRSSSFPQLRAVRCDFHEGVLTLRGKVSSFYITQMAQALAARIPGVEEVVNRIEVTETA